MIYREGSGVGVLFVRDVFVEYHVAVNGQVGFMSNFNCYYFYLEQFIASHDISIESIAQRNV